MRGVLDRGHRRQHRRRRDVERPADPVDRVDDVGGTEHPADPQCRQPVNLGKRMRHHRVFGGRHQLQAELEMEWARWFNKFRALYAMLLKREKTAAGPDGEEPAEGSPSTVPRRCSRRPRDAS